MSTFARRSVSWSLAWCLGLGLAVAAQETPKSGEAQSSAATAEFPFKGEVTCENLNVRLAPRTDAGTGVVAVLRQGEKVIALGSTGEFLVVKAPRGATAWILGKHVKREADGSGTVLVNDAALRMDSRAGAEKIGSLKEGERVSIAREHLGWYQVSAPSGVKYYVAKKHVRFLEAAAGVEPLAKPEANIEAPGGSDAAAIAKMREAKGLIDIQNKLIQESKFDEVDFSAVVATLKEAVDAAKTEPVKKEAESDYEKFTVLDVGLKTAQKNLDTARKFIEAQKIANEDKWKDREAKFEACGYVDTVGPLFHRPGAFKLMMSGKIIAFIKVKDGDEDMRVRMNRLFGKYVGVNGATLKDPPGWIDHKVVTVEQVEELIKK